MATDVEGVRADSFQNGEHVVADTCNEGSTSAERSGMAEAPKRIATTKSMRAETICEGGGAGGGVASVVWRVWRVAGGLRPSFSWPIVLAMLCPCVTSGKAIVLAMRLAS